MPSHASTNPAGEDLIRKVEELENELAQARQQQAAANEILHAISRSTADVTGILETIAKSTAKLIDVRDVEILELEGDALKSVTRYGASPQWPLGTTRPIGRDWIAGRAVIDRVVVHVADLQAEEKEFPRGAAFAREFGHRSTLAAPLLQKDTASEPS
jgi:hypothetical protein